MSEQVIISAITELSERVENRFAALDKKLDTKIDTLDERVTAAEQTISNAKTVSRIAIALTAFFGWPHIKVWLTALVR